MGDIIFTDSFSIPLIHLFQPSKFFTNGTIESLGTLMFTALDTITVEGNNNEIKVTTANSTIALINPSLKKRIKLIYSHLKVLIATAYTTIPQMPSMLISFHTSIKLAPSKAMLRMALLK